MAQESGDKGQEATKSLQEAEVSGTHAWPQEDASVRRADKLERLLESLEAKGKGHLPPCQNPSLEFAKALEEQFIQSEKKSLEEDARLDYLLRMQKTMNETFENGGWVHPHGTTDFDHCIIPECRQPEVEKYKMNIRRQNYTYMHQHPELDALMSVFIKKLLKNQPRDPVRFAVEFFTYRRVAQQDLQRLVTDEIPKLIKFQSPKGWKTVSGGYAPSPSSELKDVNEVKKLNFGPASQEFGVTPPQTAPGKPGPVKIKKPKAKPKPHVYCGCKDPGRREYAHPKVPEVIASEGTQNILEPCIGLPTHEKR